MQLSPQPSTVADIATSAMPTTATPTTATTDTTTTYNGVIVTELDSSKIRYDVDYQDIVVDCDKGYYVLHLLRTCCRLYCRCKLDYIPVMLNEPASKYIFIDNQQQSRILVYDNGSSYYRLPYNC